MTVTPWEAFAAEVREALAETTRLEALEDPEATPFKSKEAALELIEAVLTKLQQQCVCSPHTSFPSQGFGRGFSKMNEGPPKRGCGGHRTKPEALGRSAQSTLRRK
jgi:hypothetical protein